LTGAALNGPGFETSFLLLAYGVGAATSLAAGVLLGGRLLTIARMSVRLGEGLRRIFGAAVVAGAATIWLGLDTGPLTSWSSATTTRLEQDFIDYFREEPTLIVRSARAAPVPALSGPLVSLLEARQWLNTPPLQSADLRGKVVLVNFWTYSCINCLRMLPHVRAWAAKYGDHGLVVIGVHTPEFAFEKDAANVAKALSSYGIVYPVAIDCDFKIWRAFKNQAWPALYFIGADGRIRYRVFGEGGYDESGKLIEQLLSEAAAAPISVAIGPIDGKGPQATADENDLRSPETDIGYAQARNFASLDRLREDLPSLYHATSNLPLNHWGLAGTWTIGSEFATLGGPPGVITYRFHARDLHLVLAPASAGHAVRFRVTLDGAPPGADHGSDVDAEGWGQRARQPPVSAYTASAAGHRSQVRDRVFRRRCACLRLHVRLEHQCPWRLIMIRGVVMLVAGVALAAAPAVLAPASGQSEGGGAPIFGGKIPAGYRDWTLISVAHEAGSLNDLRAILGNDIAVNAYREGKLPFPDGTIIARLAWGYVPSEENNKVFGQEQSFVAGPPQEGVQFMVKDSRKFASTNGWGFIQFDDGKPVAEADLQGCSSCHEPAKATDFVFTRYAP
jgi:thiol-disulfide isomerase/thioredoxin